MKIKNHIGEKFLGVMLLLTAPVTASVQPDLPHARKPSVPPPNFSVPGPIEILASQEIEDILDLFKKQKVPVSAEAKESLQQDVAIFRKAEISPLSDLKADLIHTCRAGKDFPLVQVTRTSIGTFWTFNVGRLFSNQIYKRPLGTAESGFKADFSNVGGNFQQCTTAAQATENAVRVSKEPDILDNSLVIKPVFELRLNQ